MKMTPLKKALILAVSAAPSSLFASESVKGEYIDIFGAHITNSMFTTILAAVAIVLLLRLMIGKSAKLVPSRGQLVIETFIDALKNIMQPIMGGRAFKAAFPLLLGIFAYILLNNWSSLLPFVGTIFDIESVKISPEQASQFKDAGYAISQCGDALFAKKFVPLFKPANSDLNSTLALAIISFVAWFYYVMRYAGPKALYKDWFGNKANRAEVNAPFYFAMFGIFFFVGCVEVISAVMRIVSLSFRLFGNNFGGESLMANMSEMFISFPFYFLELLVGLVQATIFTLLTAIYIGLITGHEEASHEQISH